MFDQAEGLYRQVLGDYREAVNCYQRVVGSWPDYKATSEAQYLVGECYEQMAKLGVIPESEANLGMEKAFRALVEDHPYISRALDAAIKLGALKSRAKQWSKAARYFKFFFWKV
ncbi:MAG: tetratricopeptide repeat protein [Sedimentisphaerales bacterium]|nr:tetratricopeptide repeat protein [Sedimentisphaerales bacterium]